MLVIDTFLNMPMPFHTIHGKITPRYIPDRSSRLKLTLGNFKIPCNSSLSRDLIIA